MRAIILAAGMGRRLGHGLPKCLTPLSGMLSILDLQLGHLRRFTDDIRIMVGYKDHLVRDQYRSCAFTLNAEYERTNTAYSLALALEDTPRDDVLWINGDVVFCGEVLERLLVRRASAMAAKRCAVGDEEVKYRVDASGRITAVSKRLDGARGEAVGVNLVRAGELDLLVAGLAECGPQDYFERGVEHAIRNGLTIYEVDVSDLPCVEVDFPADLAVATELLPACLPPGAGKDPAAAPGRCATPIA